MPPKSAKYPPELRKLAVRMVAEMRTKYKSDQEAILAVADALDIHDPKKLRKWIQQSEGGEDSEDLGSSKPGILKRSVFRTHPIITGVTIAVLGGLGLTYSQVVLGVGKHEPQLAVDGVSLTAAEGVEQSNGLPGTTPFKIDIKLLNTGTQLAVINSVHLVIQKFATLPLCLSQGGFPSTGQYHGNMPTDPRPGTVVNIPVSQEVGPDSADRFDLLLRTAKTGRDADSVYLYRVRLYVNYNIGANAIDAGQMIIDLPWDPKYQYGYFWARSYKPNQFDYMGSYTPGINRCLIRNSYTLKSILSMPGTRTAILSAIPSELSTTRL